MTTSSVPLRLVTPPAIAVEPYEDETLSSALEGQARARHEGAMFDDLAFEFLETAGCEVVAGRHRVGVVQVDGRIRGTNGSLFWVLAHGNVDHDSRATLPGLRRTDTIRKAAHSAIMLARQPAPIPVLLITSHLPDPPGQPHRLLAAHRDDFFDVVSINGDLAGFHRLQRALTTRPIPTGRGPAEWADGFVQLEFGFQQGDGDA